MSWFRRLKESLRRRIVDAMSEVLTQPLRSYEQRIPNSLVAMREFLQPGDVILVEGDQRISRVIRYLTQSSWSHTALYVGNELRRFRPDLADELLAKHAADGFSLMIEATAEEGVICAPLTKYLNHNIRVCRPRGLRREDLDRMLAELFGQLGTAYNVRHIVAMGRYFFPVSLIPRRWQRSVLDFGGDTTREVICSTMVARAFGHVGFPIVPRVKVNEVERQPSWYERALGRKARALQHLYEREDPRIITPRDFDLSPYFDVMKFHYAASASRFDYRRIEWAGEPPAPPALQAVEAKPESSKASAA